MNLAYIFLKEIDIIIHFKAKSFYLCNEMTKIEKKEHRLKKTSKSIP